MAVWLANFEAHERLFCEAVRHPMLSSIREVLSHDPLVPSDKVEELAMEVFERAIESAKPFGTSSKHIDASSEQSGERGSVSSPMESITSPESVPIRVAIIGAGRMGRERATAARHCGARIVAVCDSDSTCGQKLADEHDSCRYFASWEELNWQSLDAVFVCAPPFARGPVELAAIAAGGERTRIKHQNPRSLTAFWRSDASFSRDFQSNSFSLTPFLLLFVGKKPSP
jgi:hypothetical protein